jgi:hypothetical protein
MKKVSFCIGVFIVLFLAIGVHTVKAQDLSGLNGQWLNGTLKTQQGWVSLTAQRVPQKRCGILRRSYMLV